MNRPLRVFLCHASADKSAVRNIHRYLKQRGVAPWLDEIDLLPGQKWEIEIPKALLSSDVILVCLSKNSVTKEGYVQKEITYALDKAQEKPDETIFIIPAKLEDCDVPQRLSGYQWVALFRNDGYKRLMQSLKQRAADLGPDVTPLAEDTQRIKLVVNRNAHPPYTPSGDELGKAEEERIALAKVESDRKAKEDQDRIAARKIENDRVMREKADLERKAKAERERKQIQNFKPILSAGGIILALLVLFFIGKAMIKNLPASPAPTQIPQTSEVSPTITPTFTDIPPTDTPTITPTPKPDIGGTQISTQDGMVMVFVPQGDFTMGSDSSDQPDEKPERQVYLDDYWIDQTDVTNAMFAKFVQSKSYKTDAEQKGCSYVYSSSNWSCVNGADWSHPRGPSSDNSGKDDFPVIHVSWNDAKAYCEWAGRRLPTEAEWEKAASWDDKTKTKYVYPWGNDSPTADLLNFNMNVGDTTKAGSYPKGASSYGALDMAGNVWQWVSSLYKPYPYSATDGREDLTASGDQVLRGGSWSYVEDVVRSANRGWNYPTLTDNRIGFRCSRSRP